MCRGEGGMNYLSLYSESGEENQLLWDEALSLRLLALTTILRTVGSHERTALLNRWHSFLLCLVVFVPHVYAQEFSEAIEDNSFLIEEAYNQEDRVVQHIFNGYYLSTTKDMSYTFTQEWPMGGQTHQLSYTIAYQTLNGSSSGLGDALINYRYQFWDEKDWCWIAPRLSIILPTGKSEQGLGNGVVGVQTNIAASKRWTNEFISHVNVGATVLPNVAGATISGLSVRRTLSTVSVGTSGIYLASENVNLMLEVLYSYGASITESGSVAFSSGTIVSPGVRYAINIGKLQIVPGIAFPLSFTSTTRDLNIFAYLSFEHPF
jgi:hypothetical protein